MASEIRANTLKNRVGLGTVSFTNTGPVVSGIVTANTIRLADDNKIQLGNDQDLEIVHDPSNGIIRSISSGGNMHVESKNHIELNVNYNPSNGSKHNAIKANANSSVSLYHANSTKFATTSTGAQVYGTLVATGADINGDLDVDGHTNLDNVSIAGVVTATTFVGALTGNVTGNINGNINGGTVAGTTGTFTSNLAIGGNISIPDKIIHTDDTNTSIRFPEADAVTIETNGSERFRINSSGAWGIGAAYGSSGQVLTSGGSGSSPTWTTVSGGVTSDGNGNTIGGTNSGDTISSGYRNTLFGFDTGTDISDGARNSYFGWQAGANSNGIDDVGVGYKALFTSTSGYYNTSVGKESLELLIGGTGNVAVGWQAGRTTTSGSNNIIIGKSATASSATVSNEVTIGDANIDKFRVPGLGLEFAKDHTYGVVGGRKNWFDNGSFDCIGGRRANTSMDYGNHHAYGWVTDRFQSRNSVQWTRSSNVPAGKGFSYSTQTNGAGGRLVQAVELPDYGDMGVFAPNSYWCVSLWSTAAVNQSGQAFSYDLGSTKTDIPIVTPSSGGVYLSSGETASGTSTGTFTRYYAVFQMPSSIISTASSAYWTWAFQAAGYHTGWQLERVPTATSKPTPYEHVHPSVTIARCRRYCYQNVNSRLINGYKRHDSNIHWSVQFPVPPTHMPSGSNQSVSPYGIYLHDGGLLSNFQSVLQNPGVNSVAISEFDYRSGRFLIVGSTSYSPTHTTVPAWESQEYEIMHGHF